MVGENEEVEREVIVDRVEPRLLVADLLDPGHDANHTFVPAACQADELAPEEVITEQELEDRRAPSFPAARDVLVGRPVDAVRVLSRRREEGSVRVGHQSLPSTYRVTPPSRVGPS